MLGIDIYPKETHIACTETVGINIIEYFMRVFQTIYFMSIVRRQGVHSIVIIEGIAGEFSLLDQGLMSSRNGN